jgi:hypothetical protein
MDSGSQPYYLDPCPYRPDLAYDRSDFDFGKAFKLYGMWQPNFFKSNSFLHVVADGFTISGIYTHRDKLYFAQLRSGSEWSSWTHREPATRFSF